MKHGKRVLTVLLALALLCSVIPTAWAAGGKLTYQISGGQLTITGYLGTLPDSLVIPESIDGKPVREIAAYAFMDTELTEVILPDGLKVIGDQAFYGTKLKNISIPASVEQCSDGAFLNIGLEHAYVYSDRVDFAPFDAERIYLMHSEWLDTIDTSHEYHFGYFDECGCDPATATIYEEGCMKYTLIDGEACLLEATPTDSFTVPETLGGCPVTRIAPCCFITGSRVKRLTLPDTIKSIGRAGTLTAASPNSPTVIPALPKNLEYVGEIAFFAQNLSAVTELPESLTKISYRSFANCLMTKLYIPGTLKEIPNGAFGGYPPTLTEVVLGEGVESIDYSAFSMNGGSITIPASATQISEYGIWYNIGKLVIYGYGGGAVEEACRNSQTPLYDAKTGEVIYAPPYFKTVNGIEYYIVPGEGASVWRSEADCPSEIVIPETIDGEPVIRVATFAFSSDTITSIILPDTVREIEMIAFDCKNLSYLEIQDGVEKIDDGAISYCPALHYLYLPESATTLADYIISDSMYTILLGEAGGNIESYAEEAGYAFLAIDPEKDYLMAGEGLYEIEDDHAVLIAMCSLVSEDGSSLQTYAVPDMVGEYPVTTIASEVFFKNSSAYILVLGENVTTIEPGALLGSYISRLYTTENVTSLPYPLFDYVGEIYGFSDTYAQSYAEGTEYPFYAMDTVPFKDVNKSAWYHDAVWYCYWHDMMSGVSSDRFDPNGTTTRAMLVTVLWRMCGSREDDDYYSYFSDVPVMQWYTAAVNWCASYGIVYGTGENVFSPNGKVTREQVAAILFRFADMVGGDVTGAAELSGFADAGKVASWSRSALMWAVDAGLISGRTNGGRLYLEPQGTATRAEIASILSRFVAWIG